MLLENRVALITGRASKRRLGRATARLFAEHGARAEEVAALAAFGRIDVPVNIAGSPSPQRVMRIDDATRDRIMDVNMRGTCHMTRAVVPQMTRQGGGSIVNMSPIPAQRGGGVFVGSHIH